MGKSMYLYYTHHNNITAYNHITDHSTAALQKHNQSKFDAKSCPPTQTMWDNDSLSS